MPPVQLLFGVSVKLLTLAAGEIKWMLQGHEWSQHVLLAEATHVDGDNLAELPAVVTGVRRVQDLCTMGTRW